MKTVYQVQFRSNTKDFSEWTPFNMNTKYDVTENIETAKKTLERAKEWHSELKLVAEKGCKHEYRIAKITFDVEYIQP